MSKAAELAALIGSQSSLANRNMIGNGAFNIWQKGFTNTTTASGGGKPIDRWRNGQSNVGQLSTETSRVADSPDTFPGSYSLKLQVKTPEDALAANEDMTLLTKVEGTDCQRLLYGTSNAKNTTLSFWVKSSIAGTFAVGIYQEDGNDNISKPYTISSADTWEYKTITFPGNTAAAILDDNTTGLQIQWFISIGSNSTGGSNGDVWHSYADNTFAFGHVTNTHITTDESTFQLTGVQFEMGYVVTPFEFKSFEENLAKCQRYYYQIGPFPANAGRAKFGIFAVQDSNSGFTLIDLPVTMRAQPLLVYTGTASDYSLYIMNQHITATAGFTSGGDPAYHLGNKYFNLYTEHGTSGLNAGYVGQLSTANNNTSAFLGFDAEL